MRTALALLWLLGAVTIGCALLWSLYRAIAVYIGEWRAMTVLTAIAAVVLIVWISALFEFPFQPSNGNAQTKDWW